MDDRSLDILIALAWLGIATKDQLRRLCCPEVSVKTMERCLSGLESHAPPLIVGRKRASRTSEGTRRQPTLYMLAEAAHRLLLQRDDYPRRTANGQYPSKAGGPRADHLIEHDLQVVEAVVGLIVAARAEQLSGVYLARELRIATSAGSLIPDAVLLMQFGGALSQIAVPWTKVPSPGSVVHAYAIESDRATEPHSTIVGKAQLYGGLGRIDDHERWRGRFHCDLPTPFWITITARRAEAIGQIWQRERPYAAWMVASVEQLAAGAATRVINGRLSEVALYGAPRRSRNEEPKAPPAPAPAKGSYSPQAPLAEGTPAAVPSPATASSASQSPPATGPASPTPSHVTPEIKDGPLQQVASAAPPGLTPLSRTLPASAASWSSGRPPAPVPAYELEPLPAFPQWLRPRRYHAMLINVLCVIGLICWLPLWLPMMFVERSLFGSLVIDEFLAKRLGRRRTLIIWLIVGAALVGWYAINLPAVARIAVQEAAAPKDWYVEAPASAADAKPTAIPCFSAIVTANRVNLRLAPSKDAERSMPQLNTGDRLEVCGEATPVDDHRWRPVRTADGRQGYVSDQYLELAPAP